MISLGVDPKERPLCFEGTRLSCSKSKFFRSHAGAPSVAYFSQYWNPWVQPETSTRRLHRNKYLKLYETVFRVEGCSFNICWAICVLHPFPSGSRFQRTTNTPDAVPSASRHVTSKKKFTHHTPVMDPNQGPDWSDRVVVVCLQQSNCLVEENFSRWHPRHAESAHAMLSRHTNESVTQRGTMLTGSRWSSRIVLLISFWFALRGLEY